MNKQDLLDAVASQIGNSKVARRAATISKRGY